MKTLYLENAQDTEKVAAALASYIEAPANIYLEGQLGAGKTTFVKGFIRGMGYEGLVKSPTYTLIETYDVNVGMILHADLYRIKNTNELDAMGFRDYFNPQTITLIEWASHAQDWLPKPLLICKLTVAEDGEGRILEVLPCLPVPKLLSEWMDS
jgi:tRNA threonylcarbamoyladenosine biosynthesis protein TsaE